MENGNSVSDFCIPNGKTKFCFLFGSRIEHSLSPGMHTSWFQKYGLNCIYLPLQIQEESEFISLLEKLILVDGFLGANITLPFKNSVLNLGSVQKSAGVQATQAANTIYKNQMGVWSLENTDLKGIEASIFQLIPYNETFKIIMLGGGGAAATAIYFGIDNKNCENIVCLTRNPEKTTKKYEYLKQEKKFIIKELNLENIEKIVSEELFKSGKIILINTLPLGLKDGKSIGSYGEENVFAIELIKKLKNKELCYFDLIYQDTSAILLAKEKGICHINGKFMLTTQAKESFFYGQG